MGTMTSDVAAAGTLSADQRARLDEDGYLVVEKLGLGPDDLAAVAALLDPLFDRFHEFPANIAPDLGGRRAAGQPLVPEITYVTTLLPALREAKVVSACQRMAQHYFGAPVTLTFDHAIYKPAGSVGVTPWHQDSAYDSTGRDTLTMWVPLQDTDERNGCMRYVRGSNRLGPVAHQPIVGRHGLTPVDAIDESMVRTAPVPRGGVIVHRENTFHGAGPNPSDDSRRSLILLFAPHLSAADRARLALTRAKVARVRREMHLDTH
jgi:hypothetical protein